MSIFQSNTCEIPHCNNEATEGKHRCKKCAERYDSQGIAFILYCEFHRFTNRGRGIITFWVSDDHVQKAPVPFGSLVGVHVDELYAQMEDMKRFPFGIEKATLS